MLFQTLLLTLVMSVNADINIDNDFCDISSKTCLNENSDEKKLLFYDVNPPEGFNLRRDVYMRFAIMLSEAQRRGDKSNWNLVLPPWHGLYHWKTDDKKPIPWRRFFNIPSLRTYAPVQELDDVFDAIPTNNLALDRLYVLQNYLDPFENGEFVEKWHISKDSDCFYDGEFWGYTNVTVNEVICVTFQGKMSKLWEVMSLHPSDRRVMFSHGEIGLHDNYGSKAYWDCRKSMKFNEELVAAAKNYMLNEFKCNERCQNYISVHWRRQDFTRSRHKESPSIDGTADQISRALKKFNATINKIFLATDCTVSELNSLVSKLTNLNYVVSYFTPNESQLSKYKDGGVAIIDQIVCSHSAFFIGTHESTFTFRIQEEREIMGYPSSTTFNRLCPDEGRCEKPSRWTIVN